MKAETHEGPDDAFVAVFRAVLCAGPSWRGPLLIPGWLRLLEQNGKALTELQVENNLPADYSSRGPSAPPVSVHLQMKVVGRENTSPDLSGSFQIPRMMLESPQVQGLSQKRFKYKPFESIYPVWSQTNRLKSCILGECWNNLMATASPHCDDGEYTTILSSFFCYLGNTCVLTYANIFMVTLKVLDIRVS